MHPPRHRIVVSPRAASEMAAIGEYIERDSPQNAATVLQAIFDHIDSLELLPYRYPVYRKGRPETRVMPVSPFLVYYRVHEDDLVVEIICVRHGARRQPRSFN